MKIFNTWREWMVDALYPEPSKDVIVVPLQFKPSEQALKRAEEVRKQIYENFGKYAPEFEKLKTEGIHCGDIERINVYKQQRQHLTDYALFDSNTLIAFFVLIGNKLTNGYVLPERRKQGIFSLFLFFLKRNEGLSQIILDDTQSEETVEAVKRIYKRFNTSWVKGNEKIPYDPNTIDQFYSNLKPTGWKIMLENDGDFNHWPKFFMAPPTATMMYEGFLDH